MTIAMPGVIVPSRIYRMIPLSVAILICTASFAQKSDPNEEVKSILKKYDCNKCHTQTMRLVGPPFSAVAKRNYPKERIVQLIMNPEPKNWPGYGAMPRVDTLRKEDMEKVAEWIVSLKKE